MNISNVSFRMDAFSSHLIASSFTKKYELEKRKKMKVKVTN